MTIQGAEDGAGDVAALDGSLVHVAVDGGRGTAEETVEHHVYHGAVGILAQVILAVEGAEVVGGLHDLLQVGEGSLVALGDGTQLVGEHEEGLRHAVFHHRGVGSFHQHGDTHTWRQIHDVGLGFGRQFAVLLALAPFQFVVFLLLASLHDVAVEEPLHDDLLHVSGERLA